MQQYPKRGRWHWQAMMDDPHIQTSFMMMMMLMLTVVGSVVILSI